eukprot:m.134613 g.134613  ORF g.134613 m.134613 type:complete len:305 (-) comp9654_c0_seq1:144-1058(-)
MDASDENKAVDVSVDDLEMTLVPATVVSSEENYQEGNTTNGTTEVSEGEEKASVIKSISNWWQTKAKPSLSNDLQYVKGELNDSGRKLRIFKQKINEQFGSVNRTIDLELQPLLDVLVKRKHEYMRMTELSKRLMFQLKAVMKTQQELAMAMATLAGSEVDNLSENFKYHSNAQETMSTNLEELVVALERFHMNANAAVTTLASQAFQYKSCYDTTRLEYDSHRTKYEKVKASNSNSTVVSAAEEKFLDAYNRMQALRTEILSVLADYDTKRAASMNSELQALLLSFNSHFSKGIEALQTPNLN